MDSLSIQFIKILDNILEKDDFQCKKIIFRNIKYNKNDVYYCARDVLKCLNCDKHNISKFIDKIEEENKFTISELYNMYSIKELKNDDSVLSQELVSKIRQYELKYAYVNKTGLYELILISESLEAKAFKNFIFKTLLSALDDNYQDIVLRENSDINDIININNKIFSEINKIKSIGYNILNNGTFTVV